MTGSEVPAFAVGRFTVALRPLRRDDLPPLAGWLAQPHVAPWWRQPADLPAVQAEYLPCITGDDPTEVFVIEVGGRPVGLIQRYLIADSPDWARAMAATPLPVERAVGIDYLIGDPELVGRGIGSTVIRTFTGLCFLRYPEADTVSAAVQQDNPASWRALERAGYARLWAGRLDSDDPSDAGPAFVYARARPAAAGPRTPAGAGADA